MTWVRQSRCCLSLGEEGREGGREREKRVEKGSNVTSVLFNGLRIQYHKNDRINMVCKHVINNVLFQTY